VELGDYAVSAVRYVPGSTRVHAAIALRNSLVSWEPSSRTPPRVAQIDTRVQGLSSSISFSPDARLAAVTGCDRFRNNDGIYCTKGRLEVWDIERGVLAAGPWIVHEDDVSSAAFSSDGKWMASGGGDGLVLIWDRAKGQPTAPPLRAGFVDDNTGSVSGIYRLAFSPNNYWLASGTEQGIAIWNTAHLQTPFRIPRGWGIAALAFSGDSRRIAFNGESELGDVLVWDLQAGTYAFPPLEGLSTRNDVVALSPDGARLASADRKGRVVVWDVPTDEPDEWACRVISRNPSQEELSRLVGTEPVGELCPDANIPLGGHDR
jgi:WD40 repeat protein